MTTKQFLALKGVESVERKPIPGGYILLIRRGHR